MADVKVKTWIALFRGINVGGKHRLPMTSLVALIEALGGTRVKTCIQSGNAVFSCANTTAAALSRRIEGSVLAKHGFAPRVLVLTREELERAVSANPFPQAVSAPTSLHLAFLADRPENPDFARLNALKCRGEAYALEGKLFFLHTPGGFGQSKLAAGYEKLLGVAATARNWNTVKKVLDLAKRPVNGQQVCP